MRQNQGGVQGETVCFLLLALRIGPGCAKYGSRMWPKFVRKVIVMVFVNFSLSGLLGVVAALSLFALQYSISSETGVGDHEIVQIQPSAI